MYFAFREHTESPPPPPPVSEPLFSRLSPPVDVAHPKRNGALSSAALTMMHEPRGKTLFRCCHYRAFFFFFFFFFQAPKRKRKTQRQDPTCNNIISLKLSVGVCGALAAGLSPFQLPDLFNSAGNEKCAAQLVLRSKNSLSLSLSFPPIISLKHVQHV